MQSISEESGVTKLAGKGEILALPDADEQFGAGGPSSANEPAKTSTLIEFPGVTRRVEPPWRKELNLRVREVQERRAREAADSPQVTIEKRAPKPDPVLSQLELVPELPSPAMNQVVENALRRGARARMIDPEEFEQSWARQSAPMSRYGAATAVARAKVKAPLIEESIAPATAEAIPAEVPAKKSRSLRRRNLVAVPPAETKGAQPATKPLRLIEDGIEDSALAYLENYFPNVAVVDPRQRRAGLSRRMTAAALDLAFMAFLASPFAAGVELTGGDWSSTPIQALMIGTALVVMVLYLTVLTALNGQTWGMRMVSIRALDTRSGLLPSGSQSVARTLACLLSIATLGFGPAYALIDPDKRTLADRLSRTVIVQE